MILVQCWIEHPIRNLDQTFTYTCAQPVTQGVRVLVPFGSQKLIGFVESCEETEETTEEAQTRLGITLRPVLQVLDEVSLITDELHDLAQWMRDETLSTTISCFQAMLPGKVKPVSTASKAVKEKWVSCNNVECSLTPRQAEAFAYVLEHLPLKYSDLRKQFPTQAHQLVEKGVITLVEKDREAKSNASIGTSSSFTLTSEQESAIQEIESSNDSVFLIKGVTGSGKTEVYLRLAQHSLAQGKQVLFLVPEISLTPQMIERVSTRFGSELAIYHSGLNAQEKYEQYRKVIQGKARIVVGTRSSVFLPFESLGLIVMDEEHDSSYKQDKQPCYHCRDIAIWRGRYHHCKVLLGSATPSLESNARALKNVYHRIEMTQRVNHTLPKVTVLSLKQSLRKGDSYILSNELREKIDLRLKAHQQVILLLNRRGYSSLLRCKSCQTVVLCPHCDIAMSYHREDRMLKCHTCGTMIRVPDVCPTCHQRAGFSTYGYGTERLQEEVQRAFPQSRILRMDADTTARKNGHETILSAFGKHEADILVGTQMIAKGLDYPNVTLVGIMNGDEGLARTDYRSCETTFDLLMQASGRSGRASEPGEVVIQVFDPTAYAVQCAAKQDYDTFFAMEMNFRHAGGYPPYTYMISLTLSGKDETKVEENAIWIKNAVTDSSYKTIGVLTLNKLQDRFRRRVLLKGKDLNLMRAKVKQVMETDPEGHTKNMRIDVNPLTLD